MDAIAQSIYYGRLLAKKLQGTISDEEERELNHWLDADENNRALLHQFSDGEFLQHELNQIRKVDSNAAWDTISKSIAPSAETSETPVVTMGRNRFWWWAAAVLLISCSIGGWLFYSDKSATNQYAVKPPVIKQPVIIPGGNKAILTLADGSAILLDSATNGQLASQGHTKVIKLTNGQLVYQSAGNKADELLYNTVKTPKGGQYKLTLPDGSLVWLNAASQIRFPATFSSSERRVEIEGEAYFEVAKVVAEDKTPLASGNARIPFIVSVNGLEVQVLGTHFNVNAYADEFNIKTTLLEGSVNLVKNSVRKTLAPGQQGILSEAGSIRVREDIDVEDVMAWKNGLFNFSNADIQNIMRQIGRWYDVEISYADNIPIRIFSGKITRGADLNNVLRILEQSKIHFTVEGKKIIVKP
jgi:transmembrane sensor